MRYLIETGAVGDEDVVGLAFEKGAELVRDFTGGNRVDLRTAQAQARTAEANAQAAQAQLLLARAGTGVGSGNALPTWAIVAAVAAVGVVTAVMVSRR